MGFMGFGFQNTAPNQTFLQLLIPHKLIASQISTTVRHLWCTELDFPPQLESNQKHRFPKLDTGTDSDWFKMGQGDSYVV